MQKLKNKTWLWGGILILWGIYLSIPDQKLRLVFCDVDQGDGVLLIKGNWQMLVDVGSDNGKMAKCLDRYIPFWDRKIEGIMISHWDKDHSGALDKISKSYRIENLFESVEPEKKLVVWGETKKIWAGEEIDFGEIKWKILYPKEEKGESNENSLVAIMKYRNNSFLFTGDMDRKVEGEVLSWWKGEVDGLKVAHHGSDKGTGEDWLSIIKPAVAVISVGKNSYGHPQKEVLERLNKSGIKIYRTDKEGDVVLGWENNVYNKAWILGQLKKDGKSFGKNIRSFMERMRIVIKKKSMS